MNRFVGMHIVIKLVLKLERFWSSLKEYEKKIDKTLP